MSNKTRVFIGSCSGCKEKKTKVVKYKNAQICLRCLAEKGQGNQEVRDLALNLP